MIEYEDPEFRKPALAKLIGIEHPAYSFQTDELPEETRASLVKDLD